MPEMIAMLNGLPRPASQMLPANVNPYYGAYRYRLNGFGAAAAPVSGLDEVALKAMIDAATEADVVAVEESIKAGAVSADVKAALLKSLKKKFRKFYQNPLYWVAIAAVAYVGFRLYKGLPILPQRYSGLGGKYGQPMYQRAVKAQVWVDAVAPDGSTYSKLWTGRGSAKRLIARLRKQFKADGYKHIHIKSWGYT